MPAEPTRRTVLAGAVGGMAAGAAGGRVWLPRRHPPTIPLFGETVAFSSVGVRTIVPVGGADLLVHRSRVVRFGTESAVLLADQAAWLQPAPHWAAAGDWSHLAQDALLDLWVLAAGLPAPVAGWTLRWRYVWPRDTACVAVALARCGHRDRALAALTWLQGVQHPDGWFEARYTTTGRTPDDRPRQLDGSGWLLWSLDRVLATYDATERPIRARAFAPLVHRSVHRILDSLDTGSGLPDPSPDYWEVDESEVTLGTLAPLASGLESAIRLLPLVGSDPAPAAKRLRDLDRTIADRYGNNGWPRHLGGEDPDISVAMLLPPFRDRPNASALAGLRSVIPRLKRPGGGLAPGIAWHDDGIGWTPETALAAVALAHAGEHTAARPWLGWLRDHRTAAGSLPEKVLDDGRPAAVAPLSWTAALVLLSIGALEEAGSA